MLPRTALAYRIVTRVAGVHSTFVTRVRSGGGWPNQTQYGHDSGDKRDSLHSIEGNAAVNASS
jgi:hypothetical protein